MHSQSVLVTIAAILASTSICFGQQKEVNIVCIDSIPNKKGGEQAGMAVGTIVGVVAGAAASDGDVTVMMTTAWLGCEAGGTVGKAFTRGDPGAMFNFNTRLLRIDRTGNLPQAIVRYWGESKLSGGTSPNTPPPPPEGPGGVSWLDPGHSIIVPLTDDGLKMLGVSDADRKNITPFVVPPSADPKDGEGQFREQINAVGRVFESGARHLGFR